MSNWGFGDERSCHKRPLRVNKGTLNKFSDTYPKDIKSKEEEGEIGQEFSGKHQIS
jgi:hypothetical protein